MKRNLLFIIALFVCVESFGQGEIEAYRYSGNDLSGTARGQAMGGAFGALGGDVTGVAINPAGIGIYRRSEITANMSIASNTIKADWNGKIFTEGRSKFNFENLSYVGYHALGDDNVEMLNFGFNYNRLKNFNRTYKVGGSEMKSSLTDYIAAMANYANKGNGIYWEDMNKNNAYSNGNIPWLSTLGWRGYLIINDKSDYKYEGLFPNETTNPALKVSEKGYIESYDFSLGTSFSNKLFVGVTLALTNMSYSMTSTYDEDFAKGGGFTLSNELETTGWGAQLKIGAIFSPMDAFRFGVSYHSPTWYSMSDRYFLGTVDTYYVKADKTEARAKESTPSNVDPYDYFFQTPSVWTFSAAAFMGSRATVSVDYEIKDYSTMSLKNADGYKMDTDNDIIKSDFKSTSTLRAGLEVKFTPQFSGRLGYARSQNPYKSNVKAGEQTIATVGTIPHYTLSGDVTYLTGGIGYRFTPDFYIDVAFVYRSQTDDLYFYSPVADSKVTSYPAVGKNNTSKGLITLGYKF